jgi:predicted DNA-binding transcriptional regulator AlpA
MKNKIKLKIRVKNASEIYSVAQSTIWLYIKQGKLTTTKPSPRVTLLDTIELETFFNNNN